MPLTPDKRPSGIYRIRGTHHGVRVDRSARTRSKAEADRLAEAWERKIFDEVVLGRPAAESFAELARDFMKAGRTLGPRSVDILLKLGPRRADSVTQADCDLLAAEIYPDAKPSTVNRNIIAPLSAIMNWGADSGRVPLRRWKRRRERSKATDWRRPAEMEKILAALNSPEARALVAMHLGGGLRASEAVFLDGREVAPDLSSVFVRGSVRGDDEGAAAKGYAGTKGFLDRRVRLPERARVFLAPVINTGAGRALVNSSGQAWSDRNALNKTLRRACTAAGFAPMGPHALRHCWATWHNAVHGDPRRLMDEGGWSDLSLVQRYAHVADDTLRDEVIASGWAIVGQRPAAAEEKDRENNAEAA